MLISDSKGTKFLVRYRNILQGSRLKTGYRNILYSQTFQIQRHNNEVNLSCYILEARLNNKLTLVYKRWLFYPFLISTTHLQDIQNFSNPLTNLNLFPFIDFSHRLSFVFVTKQTTDLDVDIALILPVGLPIWGSKLYMLSTNSVFRKFETSRSYLFDRLFFCESNSELKKLKAILPFQDLVYWKHLQKIFTRA